MKFTSANVKAVKADLAKGNITITFTIPLNDRKTAEDLAQYAGKDASDMVLEVTPRQPGMFASDEE